MTDSEINVHKCGYIWSLSALIRGIILSLLTLMCVNKSADVRCIRLRFSHLSCKLLRDKTSSSCSKAEKKNKLNSRLFYFSVTVSVLGVDKYHCRLVEQHSTIRCYLTAV